MDQIKNPLVKNKSQNKALRFVGAMGLVVLGTSLICGLIWWIIGDHSFDTLGRIIMLGGGILMFIGLSCIKGHGHYYSGREKDFKQDGSSKNTKTVLFFWASGLLCLFVGNLITLGL